ncbi:MAG: hypothetical protein HYX28_10770 [Candidatus Koribacter versatilis]|uniref:Uncharacterized protein n=1 Tax=Candidatus Korobacter versatilis TaxID=658062 RepID=A0A932A9V8_9BACT|nr:hypothetical protein [Candidatus Koribacter versatilis]
MQPPQELTAKLPSAAVEAMQQAARCEHIKLNGQRCHAPALREERWCRFHRSDYEGVFPITGVPEDAATIQIELGRVIRQLQHKDIDAHSAGLIIYALQTASMNLKRLGAEMPASTAPASNEELVAALYRQLDPPADRAVDTWCDLAAIVRRMRGIDPPRDDDAPPAPSPRIHESHGVAKDPANIDRHP